MGGIYLLDGNLEVEVGNRLSGVIRERGDDMDLILPRISPRRELDLDCGVVNNGLVS